MTAITPPRPAIARRHGSAARQHARHAVPASAPRIRGLVWLSLALILTAQVVLSVRLVPLSLVTGDESLYIYGGHQLIHEFWHGGGSPYYETFFSGAPVFYPVLAAMVDALGGLVAVRLMSLMFMLAATALLYATTRRIFGYWPGVSAAGLFAGLGLTQGLGALATFDALALMLTAAAAYCAVRAAEDGPHAAAWLLLVPTILLAANAAKYASAIFDPVVVSLAALLLSGQGLKRVIRRSAALSAAIVLLAVVVAFLAGTAYLKGILVTTLARQQGTQGPLAGMTVATPAQILTSSWDWVGVVICLGILALIAALLIPHERRNAAMLALMVLASLLVIAEYLHLESNVSFSKHTDYAAWFTCMAAGYAVARATELARTWRVRLPLAVAAIAATVSVGAHYADINVIDAAQARAAASTDLRLYAVLKPYLELNNGRYLIGGLQDTRIIYTDHVNVAWYQYFDDVYIKYPIPGRGGDSHGQRQGRACFALRPRCMYLEGPAGYRAAIHAHWFDLISMAGDHHIGQDTDIMAAVWSTPGYMLLTTLGGAPTYIYGPAYTHNRTR